MTALRDRASLHAQVKILEARLPDFDVARRAWREYTNVLRGIVRVVEHECFGQVPDSAEFLDSVAECDPLRLIARNAIYSTQPKPPVPHRVRDVP